MTKKQKTGVFSYILPFGLSAVLLGWLFYKIDYKEIWNTIRTADAQYLWLAAGVYFAANFIIWWRWMILMDALGLKYSRLSSLRWFFMGNLCNLLPLTTVGGDVVKGMGLSKESGNKPRVFASIVVDRLIGFAGIVLVAFLAFWGGHHIIDDASIMVSVFGMTLVSVAMVVFLFNNRIFSKVAKMFARWSSVHDGLMKLHYDVVLMKGKARRVWVTLGISIFGQVVLAFDYYLIAKALHQEIPLLYFVIFSPLICVATTFPSVGGLGFREFGWKMLLLKIGVSEHVAVALGLINFSFMVAVGCWGGLFYVSTLSFRRVQHHQAVA